MKRMLHIGMLGVTVLMRVTVGMALERCRLPSWNAGGTVIRTPDGAKKIFSARR